MTTNSTTNLSNYEAYRAADAAATRAFLAYEDLREIADAAWLKAVNEEPRCEPVERQMQFEILNETHP